jgi:cysteine dioxygenase
MSSVTQAQSQDCFQKLVTSLREQLGPSSGINSEDVDERELQKRMEEYESNTSEWEKYYFPSPLVPYTRNLVDKGNGKSNLVCFE